MKPDEKDKRIAQLEAEVAGLKAQIAVLDKPPHSSDAAYGRHVRAGNAKMAAKMAALRGAPYRR